MFFRNWLPRCRIQYLLVLFSMLGLPVAAVEPDLNTVQSSTVQNLIMQNSTNQADTQKSSSTSNVLVLKPNKCVALREGRKCFATVEVRWQVPTKGDYCLRRQHDQMVINCWKEQTTGNFSYVFGSENKELLELVEQSEQRIISTAAIQVRWVYKSKRKKSRWRIF